MKTNTLMPLGVRGLMIAGAAVAIFASLVMFANADTAPTVSTTAYNASNTAITSAPIGSNVYLVASVASSSTTTPATGTVTFNRFSNTSCSGSPAGTQNVSLVGGMGTSSSFAMTSGGISYIAAYNGDANNVTASSSCQAISATASSTSIVGTLSTTTAVLAGTSVSESATISGATANAGGSVAYKVYSNNSCTTLWGNAGSKTVTNALVASSDPFNFNFPGTYYWQATYSGDASNVAATSSCISLSVLATSSNATAAIGGNVYNDLNSNSSKDGGESGVQGLTVNLYQGSGFGGGVYKTTSTDASGNYSFGSLANGTYSVDLVTTSAWQQVSSDYSSVVVSNQTSVNNVNFAIHSTATTTNPGNGSISGTVYKDANKNDKLDSGDTGLAGFTVNLYGNAGWWGNKGNKDPIKTMVSDSNGNYSFGSLADGTYSVELIEQKKNGWLQSTDDFKKLVIKNGAALTGINFGNTMIATSTGNGHGHQGDNDNDNDDHGNNGNHNGWWNNFWGHFGSTTWWGNK